MSVEELAVSRARLAELCDEAITDAQDGLSKRSMVIGWYGAKMKAENLFVERGYANQKEYFEARGIGRTTWWETTTTAHAFHFLPKEQFLAMKLENAKLLSRLNDEQRYDEELVAKAATESIEEFALTVAQYEANLEARPVGEMRGKLKLSMTRDQIKVVKDNLGAWMRAQEIDDEGFALECLIAEVTHRETLVATYCETIRQLRSAAVGNKRYLSVDDALDEMLLLAGAMQKMLNAAVGETPGGKAKIHLAA